MRIRANTQILKVMKDEWPFLKWLMRAVYSSSASAAAKESIDNAIREMKTCAQDASKYLLRLHTRSGPSRDRDRNIALYRRLYTVTLRFGSNPSVVQTLLICIRMMESMRDYE